MGLRHLDYGLNDDGECHSRSKEGDSLWLRAQRVLGPRWTGSLVAFVLELRNGRTPNSHPDFINCKIIISRSAYRLIQKHKHRCMKMVGFFEFHFSFPILLPSPWFSTWFSESGCQCRTLKIVYENCFAISEWSYIPQELKRAHFKTARFHWTLNSRVGQASVIKLMKVSVHVRSFLWTFVHV